MSETFTYCASIGARQQVRPRARTAIFGDGYSQRVADGINTKQEVWSLAFNGLTDVEAAAIEDFLEARNAVEAFTWTTPAGDTIKVVCPEWSREFTEPDVNSIAAEFQLVYDS